jgi:uncharacterized protein YodC (DUF2158 family)
MSDIKAGDVVKLKSGGVAMTVAWIEDGSAYCQWQDGSKAVGENYQVIVLEAFDPHAGAAAFKAAMGR